MPSIAVVTVPSAAAAQLPDLLMGSRALQVGHFQLSSGLHSAHYVQCARLLECPRRAQVFGELVADSVRDLAADLVVGPALGGILIAHEVARALGLRCVFTERQGSEMALRRGFEVQPDERALVVEDVVTTGKSIRETRRAVEEAGGRVVGFACIVSRMDRDELDGLPLRGLLRLALEAFAPDDCPDCARGEPVIKPGSRPA